MASVLEHRLRQSSDYLVGMFAAFRKAMHKAGLRWYGVRVAEPHHDGTVHWHLLCFMRKKDRRAITALLRKFATRKENVFISWMMRLLIVVSLAWTGWAITLVFYLLTVIAFWITRNQMAQQVAA
ncbi:DNZ54_00345 family protein [Escherichia coli]